MCRGVGIPAPVECQKGRLAIYGPNPYFLPFCGRISFHSLLDDLVNYLIGFHHIVLGPILHNLHDIPYPGS